MNKISFTITINIYLTLQEFIYYIWLPIFSILLIITISLLVLYIKKKRNIKKEMMLKEKYIEEREKLIIEEINNIIQQFIKEKDGKKAVIQSYNSLRTLLENLFNIKPEPHMTEREILFEYYKKIPSNSFREILNRLYSFYEKVRFGEKKLAENEIQEYLYNLKEISNRIRYAVT